MKTTFRGAMSGRNSESQNDRWFEARIAAPSGTVPVTFGRKTTRRSGPSNTCLRSEKNTVTLFHGRVPDSLASRLRTVVPFE